jgi:ATP-dependent protease HslVU (ClpYQ) peptidase subunit
MTTLIAYQGDGFCVIAADSQTTFNNLSADCSTMGKIAVNKKFLVSAAGTVRGMNLIQHSFNPPALRLNTNLDSYMINKFVPALRTVFIQSGYDIKDSGDIASHENDFIVAINGTLFFIDSVYGVERNKDNIHISGSGQSLALGAAHALGIQDSETYEEVVDIIVRAVETAIKFDIYSSGAVQIAVQFADGKTLMTTLDNDDDDDDDDDEETLS